MALTTYPGLLEAIRSWMAERTDILAQADTFVDLAESDINRLLRVREMEASETLTPDANGQATLPEDYLEYRAVVSTNNPRRNLQLIDPMTAEHRYGFRDSGLPSFFTIVGDTIQILPVSSTDIQLLYYQRLPELTDDDPSNWLLAKSPNTYLFGALRYAAEWISDWPHADRMEMRFAGEVAKLNADDKGQRYARAASIGQGQKP
jgi:hypothetical protein